ncbi:MAG: hypothetical protein R3309_17280 [Reinekea sp.]|nr:hypothetical protein [Reinekea sp.]
MNRRTDQFYGQNGFAEFRNLGTLGDFNRRASAWIDGLVLFFEQ